MDGFPVILHLIRRAQISVLALSLALTLPLSATVKKSGTVKRSATVKKQRPQARLSATVKKRRPPAHRGAAHAASWLGIVAGGPWTVPTYADSTGGDNIAGDDPTIRRIAIRALGPYNGSVVIVDSSTGRILSILNQRLALGPGYQPCSTIKVSVALAALSENAIGPGLTGALAHSSNYFFANLGTQLGFEKVSYYARQFGYGEKAGLNIPGEEAGHFPLEPPHNGGVAMLTSFGEEVSQTPLQLAALMGAIANGGTLYSLQYPRNAREAARFTPQVKRKLNLDAPIAGITPGLREAVESGTARRARQEEPISGKTGTCSENHAHLGWFGAFNNAGRRLVVVVLLRGGPQATGPRAAAIAGEIYGQLGEANYLVNPPRPRPAAPRTPPLVPSASLPLLLLLISSSAILILIWRKSKLSKFRFGVRGTMRM
jgi:beta-lactamase class D